VDMSDCCPEKSTPILYESDASYTFIAQFFCVKYLDGVAVVRNVVTLDIALPSGPIRKKMYRAFQSSLKPHEISVHKLMT
jgi:dolichyl-phosphate-mannose--protein O-mannosyl transferase